MNIFHYLSELIFPTPRICPFCLSKQDKLQICSSCQRKLRKDRERLGQCQCCKTFGVKATVCDNCRSWPKYLAGNVAAVPYRDSYREVLHRYKFNREGWLAPVLVELIMECIPKEEYDLIVPVPLHAQRFRERGFNQSALIAKALAEKLDMSYNDKILLRKFNTPHQTGLSRGERKINLDKAFIVSDKALISNKRIYLVDDVITTGVTLHQCAKTLKQAGAKTIKGITFGAGVV